MELGKKLYHHQELSTAEQSKQPLLGSQLYNLPKYLGTAFSTSAGRIFSFPSYSLMDLKYRLVLVGTLFTKNST